MEIIGKLIKILPEQSGTTEKGTWIRGGFVIEYQDGEYPQNAAFTLFGENKINMAKNIPLGSQVKVNFSIRSREYQERWYTDLSCFRVETVEPNGMYQQPYQQPAYQPGYTQPVYQQQPYPQQQPQQFANPAQPAQVQQQPAQPVYPDAAQGQPTPSFNNFGGGNDMSEENDLPF